MNYFTTNLTLLATSLKKISNYILKDFNELSYLSLSTNNNENFALHSFKFIETKIKEDISKIKSDYSYILNSGKVIENKDKSNYIVISNINGFNNFKKGLPLFTVSLALIRDNQEFAAVIYNPLIDSFFMAEKNKGAFLNKYKLKSIFSSVSNNELTIATNNPTKLPSFLQNSQYFTTQNTNLDLCYLAALKIDLYISTKSLNYFEILPALIIAKEAGLKVTYTKEQNNIENLIVAHPLLRENLKI